jgi:hypothetical protein
MQLDMSPDSLCMPMLVPFLRQSQMETLEDTIAVPS